MKKLLAALIFAGFGIVIAQDAPQPPADKPAPPKNEQGGRPGRPGGKMEKAPLPRMCTAVRNTGGLCQAAPAENPADGAGQNKHDRFHVAETAPRPPGKTIAASQ